MSYGILREDIGTASEVAVVEISPGRNSLTFAIAYSKLITVVPFLEILNCSLKLVL